MEPLTASNRAASQIGGRRQGGSRMFEANSGRAPLATTGPFCGVQRFDRASTCEQCVELALGEEAVCDLLFSSAVGSRVGGCCPTGSVRGIFFPVCKKSVREKTGGRSMPASEDTTRAGETERARTSLATYPVVWLDQTVFAEGRPSDAAAGPKCEAQRACLPADFRRAASPGRSP